MDISEMSFYYYYSMYRDEGYEPEQAERMASNMVLGQAEHDTIDVIFKTEIDWPMIKVGDEMVYCPF